jgi:uncharacterized protein YbjT (DUF2867 family)
MPRSLLPPQTLLLLGASGKIGLEIRKTLHAQAPTHRLICCSRQPWHGEVFPQEQWITWDPFTDPWDFGQPIDGIINAVGAIQATKAMPFERVHGGLTELLCQHRAALGHPRIVQVSALGADLQQSSTFLRTKTEADALLLAQPDVCIVRPSIVCTPGTMLSLKLCSLLKMARFGFGKLLVPSGFPFTQIQPILGSDVGCAIVHAALRPDVPQRIDLVGPQRIAFGELMAEMAAAQGREVRLLEVSRDIMETFVKHFVSVWFPDLINYDQFQLLFQDNVGDLSQTKSLLGRMPSDTLPFWRAEAAGSSIPTTADNSSPVECGKPNVVGG